MTQRPNPTEPSDGLGIPTTDRGRYMVLGLLLLSVGLAIGLPPIAFWGPGAALAVPGGIVFILALIQPPERAE